MKRSWCAAVVFAVCPVAAVVSTAQGALLGLAESLPLAQASPLEVQYSAATDQLTIVPHPMTGDSLNLTTPDLTFNNTPINPGMFSLTATIDEDGIASAATLRLTGDLGAGEETLFFSDTLLQFGFGGADIFEFVFVQQDDPSELGTNESLVPLNTSLGVLVSFMSADFDATDPLPFGTDFATGQFDFTAFSKTFPIPEPCSATLLALGLLALVGRRCFRGRRTF